MTSKSRVLFYRGNDDLKARIENKARELSKPDKKITASKLQRLLIEKGLDRVEEIIYATTTD